MDDHSYFGWYRGDAVDYYQERRAAYGQRAASQPFTFTECVGSYLSAGGDTDVSESSPASFISAPLLLSSQPLFSRCLARRR